MAEGSKHRIVPFPANRQLVAASCAVGRERNIIHCVTEVDITEPRRLIREHQARTAETLSLTAYVVTCLARALAAHPELNAFRRGRKLVLLDDVTISTLVERDLQGEKIPEPLPIRAAQSKSYRQIHDEVRAAQVKGGDQLGGLSGMEWVPRWIPGFLLRTFLRLASRNIRLAEQYGKIGVTAVGMFSRDATWFFPLTTATVTVTVGSIVPRVVEREGKFSRHEFLCLTVSFDHDVVDGAPGARFVKRFGEVLRSGEAIRELIDAHAALAASSAPTEVVAR